MVRADALVPPSLLDGLPRAAERGLGVAFVPSLAVASRIARGALVPVLPGVLRARGQLALVYPERELGPPPVRAFVDWMLARAPSVIGSA